MPVRQGKRTGRDLGGADRPGVEAGGIGKTRGATRAPLAGLLPRHPPLSLSRVPRLHDLHFAPKHRERRMLAIIRVRAARV